MVALREQRHVGETLERLASALESLEFGPGATVISADRDRIAGTIRSYLIPRATDGFTPMTVVVAGPTGSGKSTLINSLSGLDVSRTGAVRPTTRMPVVLTPPGWADKYETIGGVSCEVVVGVARILDSVVLVDAPDLDSTSTDHRAMAERLIDNADVVVFVASALRYADDIPWQVLRRADSRGTPVIPVLNRVGSSSSGAIVDYKSRLLSAGFDSELITVSEHTLADEAQRVSSLAIRSLQNRLGAVLDNRDEFAADVFSRVLRSTVRQVTDLTGTISKIHGEIADLEAEMFIQLVDRVSGLDVNGLGRGLYPPPPRNHSRRAIRRWKRVVDGVDGGSIAASESKLVDGLVDIVHSDIRQWLVEDGAIVDEAVLEPAEVISRATTGTRRAVEGWVAFVSRIAESYDPRRVWLYEAVLLDAATSDEAISVVATTFGDEGPMLVDRARRELIGRLEAVYQDVGRLVAEAARRRLGDLDASELTASFGAMTSTLAPVYA